MMSELNLTLHFLHPPPLTPTDFPPRPLPRTPMDRQNLARL